MCRKLGITLLVVVAGLAILSRTRLAPVMSVCWDRICTRAEKQISPEDRIQMLRKEIARIDGELKKAVNTLVRHEVDAQMLGQQVERLRKDLQERRTELEELVTVLESDSPELVYQGKPQPAAAVQGRLDRVRADYENKKALLRTREALLKTKNETLAAADQRITRIKEKKGELTVLVEQLETQLELLRLKQMENRIEIDDSQISKCEQLYQDIQRQLLEEEKRAEMYVKYGLTATESSRETSAATREASLEAARQALRD